MAVLSASKPPQKRLSIAAIPSASAGPAGLSLSGFLLAIELLVRSKQKVLWNFAMRS